MNDVSCKWIDERGGPAATVNVAGRGGEIGLTMTTSRDLSMPLNHAASSRSSKTATSG